MHFNKLRGKSVLFMGLVVALGVIGVQLALAVPPPPPPFVEFTVTNNVPLDVTNIHVTFAAGHDTGTWSTCYHTSDALDLYHVTIDKLPAGRSHTISIPTLFCVAEISVMANCPGPLSMPLKISAQQNNFDPSDPDIEWAGFTKNASNGTTKPFGLTFMPVAGQPPKAKLEGLSRWGTTELEVEAEASF